MERCGFKKIGAKQGASQLRSCMAADGIIEDDRGMELSRTWFIRKRSEEKGIFQRIEKGNEASDFFSMSNLLRDGG